MFFSPLCHRLITKMDKISGSKIPFMSEYPEFGRLDSLDIYADENRDGNSMKYHIILKKKLCFMHNGVSYVF